MACSLLTPGLASADTQTTPIEETISYPNVDNIEKSYDINIDNINDKNAAINFFTHSNGSNNYHTLMLLNENVNIAVTEDNKSAINTQGDEDSDHFAYAILKINTEDDKNKKVTKCAVKPLPLGMGI